MFCDPKSHVTKFEAMGHTDVEVVEEEPSADESLQMVSPAPSTSTAPGLRQEGS